MSTFLLKQTFRTCCSICGKKQLIKFESSGDLFREAYSRYNTTALDNQDTFGQIKNG